MLKIKDNVDLKELEKFGFKEEDDLGIINYFYKKDNIEIRIVSSKIVVLNCYCEGFAYMSANDDILAKLYDLIKADLVEKVEDKGE